MKPSHPLAARLSCLLLIGFAAVPQVVGEDSAAVLTLTRPTTAAQERHLVQGLLDIGDGRLEEALESVTSLTRGQPDFSLAQLVYGDLLSAFSGGLPAFGYAVPADEVAGLREEARARLSRYLQAPPKSTLPQNLLQVPPSVGATLIVDLEGNRLFVFSSLGGRLQRTADYYVSIGKGGADKRFEGDEKTPVGVYRVSSYLPGERLPDMYGEGAFPIDYPNGWDRLRGRTGSGIWIHGTESDRYSRPPLSSRGCVTLTNSDFLELKRHVEVAKTPVVVSRGLQWLPPEQVRNRRDEMLQVLETWRRDWESRDAESYLRHYSEAFHSDEMDRAAFAAHKRRVNPGKRFIQVRLSDLGLFAYPGEDGLVVVQFEQEYRSDNFQAKRRKQQYWRREESGWKIVYEAGA